MKIVNYNKKINKFRFPKFELEKINSRITIAYYPQKTDFFSYLQISLTEFYYPENIDGLAYFTASMIKKTTQNKTKEFITEYLENRGSIFSISVSHDAITLFLKTLPEYFEESIDIVTDCLFNPAFNPNEIEKHKSIQIADLQQDLNEPSFLCSQALDQLIFNGHFYSSPISGTEKSLKNIQSKDCINFHNDLINNSKVNIIVGGKYKRKIIEKKLNQIIQNFNQKRQKKFIPQKISKIDSNKIIFINKKIQQAALKIAKQTINFRHKDSIPILFINTIFGGYFMSRLNALIREKHGYTYGIYSNYINYKFASLLTITSTINAKVLYDALQKIFEQMNIISIEKINNKEFQTVKNYFLGYFLRSIETTSKIIEKINSIILYDLDINYFNILYNKIQNLTIDQIYPIQKKYFKPEKLNISIVGNKKTILNQLEKLHGYELIQKSKPL